MGKVKWWWFVVLGGFFLLISPSPESAWSSVGALVIVVGLVYLGITNDGKEDENSGKKR